MRWQAEATVTTSTDITIMGTIITVTTIIEEAMKASGWR
jgi:hypothetical protein